MPGGRSRSESVSDRRLAVARDHDPVHLESPRRTPRGSPPGSATPRAPRGGAPRGRRASRRRKMPRWPPESAGFSTAGKPTSSAATPPLGERRAAPRSAAAARRASAKRRRIATLCVISVRGLGADPRQAARLGDRGDDRHGAVGRDRQHAVDAVPARGLEHAPSTSREVDSSATSAASTRARPGCGRPRPRAGRAPSPAGSRAAGGGPRRRRGRSSPRSDATSRRGLHVAG